MPSRGLRTGGFSRQEAVNVYETEMRVRGKEAVDISREACIDAHNYKKISG